jgi:hypothetical protein
MADASDARGVLQAFQFVARHDPVAFHIEQRGYLDVAEAPCDATDDALVELVNAASPHAAAMVHPDDLTSSTGRSLLVHWRAHAHVHLILARVAGKYGFVVPRVAAFRFYSRAPREPRAQLRVSADAVQHALASLASMERHCVHVAQQALCESRDGVRRVEVWHLMAAHNRCLAALCFRPHAWRTVEGRQFAARARAHLRAAGLVGQLADCTAMASHAAATLIRRLQNGETDNVDEPVAHHWTGRVPPEVDAVCRRNSMLHHAPAQALLHYTAPRSLSSAVGRALSRARNIFQ